MILYLSYHAQGKCVQDLNTSKPTLLIKFKTKKKKKIQAQRVVTWMQLTLNDMTELAMNEQTIVIYYL